MVVDTSAIVAVLFEEVDGDLLLRRIVDAPVRRMSAASLVEAGIVVDGQRNTRKGPALDALIARLDILIEPVTHAQAMRARAAYRRFGRGNHRAGLNFGDCFAYALAEERGEALLHKGGDFELTDVAPALP